MNKDSIYKLIGYRGEYNSNVKKAIRKLLKENHPDNNGNRKNFELINEVKNELESNRVSYKYQNDKNIKKSDDINYDYCYERINDITKKKDICTNNLKKKNEQLAKYVKEYNGVYRKSIDLENNLLSNIQYMDKLKNIKAICIILLFLAFLVFIFSVWKSSIVFFVVFIIISMICILIIYKSFFILRNITENNKNKVKKYVGVISKIRHNQSYQKELQEEINKLNIEINNLENDLRFYTNIVNNRGMK